ncbi:DUF4304 domain-containing protein [Nocardia sp. NPDC056100]|uniref:DUF4304 domain-containing protein n=1 Tax=Nocardia sp. NPDC056100 TaxID=3345712 RepID=UPI0035D956D3
MDQFDCTKSYRELLRDRVGPVLRSAGWKGTAPTWTITNPAGNRAVVNFQGNKYSRREQARFFINLRIQPKVWVEYWKAIYPDQQLTTKSGLWFERMDPPGANEWNFTTAAEAEECFDHIVARLNGEALPTMQELLDNERLIALLTSRSATHPGVAVLLTENGPSKELTALCRALQQPAEDQLRRRYRDQALDWIETKLGPIETWAL